MIEKVVRNQRFSALSNSYEAIVTERNEYVVTSEHRYIWRRCSDNVRGRLVTHTEGIEFTPVDEQ